MNRTLARVLRRLAITGFLLALVLAASYFVATRFLLNLDFAQRLANRRPERVQISWSSARSPAFGVFEFENFRLVCQGRPAQWSVEADHVRGAVDLFALFRQRLETSDIVAGGLTVRVRRMVRPEGVPGRFGGLAPSFPQFDAHPLPPPPPKPPPGVPVPVRTGWHFDFPSIEASEIREVWIEEIRYTGSVSAKGGFRMTLGGNFELDESAARFEGGPNSRFAFGSDSRFSELAGTLHGRIAPYRPRDLRGWKVLSQMTAGAEVTARSEGLDVLGDVTKKAAPWLELRGGPAGLTAVLQLERGRWRPPTRIEAQPRRVEAQFFDYLAAGEGKWSWRIDAAEGDKPETARLEVKLDQVTVARNGGGKPYIEGARFRFAAATPKTEILEPLVTLRPERLDLENATVRDMTVYNGYLPAATKLRIRSGSATARAHLQPLPDDPQALSGSFDLEARRVRATAEDTSLRGDLVLRAIFPRLDWKERDVQIAGTRLELRNVEVDNATGSSGQSGSASVAEPTEPAAATAASAPAAVPIRKWWATAKVDRGRIRPGQSPFLDGHLTVRLADSRPLIALLEQRKPLPSYISKALTIDDVQANGTVRLWTGEMKISDLVATGGADRIEFRAHLARRDDQPLRGVFYGRWRKLGIGLELKNGERDLHLLGPLAWFEKQTPP